MSYETRKLPKRTVFTISIVIVLGIIFFSTLQIFKNQKFTEILNTLEHKNIKNLKVVNKQTVEDMQTKFKSTVYKVAFYDIDLEKNCIGFIHKNRDKNYFKDIDCK